MRPSRPLVRQGLWLAAAVGLVWLANRRTTAPLPDLIDWEKARSLALAVARRDHVPQFLIRPALVAQYTARVRRCADLIAGYTGLTLPQALEAVYVLDRSEWIDTNIENFRLLFAPLERLHRTASPVVTVGRRVAGLLNQALLSGQIGVLLGYLARRVLGQYDLALLGREPLTGGRLYFVEPNIAHLEHTLGLPGEDLRLWVSLHETTHAFEFEATPWLREHLNRLLLTYIETLAQDLFRLQTPEGLARLVERAVQGLASARHPVELMMSAEQRRLFWQLQALMSLLEGYSNHVMDRLGHDLLPSYHTLRAHFEARLWRRGVVERLFARLTGLDLKIEQYTWGERFVNSVVRERGLAFLNQVWQGPDRLPTIEEIRDPARWIARLERGGT